jgi:hypothetical protein
MEHAMSLDFPRLAPGTQLEIERIAVNYAYYDHVTEVTYENHRRLYLLMKRSPHPGRAILADFDQNVHSRIFCMPARGWPTTEEDSDYTFSVQWNNRGLVYSTKCRPWQAKQKIAVEKWIPEGQLQFVSCDVPYIEECLVVHGNEWEH